MALTVGELVAFLRVERSAWDRALDKAEAKIKVASTAIRASLDEAGRFDGEGLRSGMDRAAAGAMSLISRLAAIPSAAQGMGGAVSMVGSLSGALGLLPAVALSGASAMAALKIGMSGFSDALSNVDDPEKFNKALDRLAPSARDLAVAIRDVKPAWDDVKQSIQHELFTGVADRIRPLATTYLPLLRDGLGAIAAGFNTAALGIADWLAEAQTSSDVGLIFAATETAVDDLAGATRPLLAAFRDLAAVGAEVLPGLTAGADTAAQRFAKFVHEARQSGRLKEWISGGLSAIGDLARVLGNLGAIAAQVFSALGAGGGGALQTLLTLTGAVREFLSSAQGQEVLTTLGMALGQISTVASGVLLTALRALAPALVDLAPAAAELATQVGSVLSGAIQVAGPAIQGVAGFLRDAMSWLGPTALAVFGLVKAYEAWGVAARLVNTIMSANPWMAIIAGVVLLVTVIVTHWDEIKAYLGKAWDWLVEKAGEAWGWIKEHIVQPLKDAGAWVVRQTQQLGDALSTAWQWCVDRARDAWRWVHDLIVTPISDAAAWVGRRVDDIVNFFGWLGSLPGRVAAWFGQVHQAAVDRLVDLVGWVRGLPGRILDAVGDLGSLLYNAGRDVLAGLWNGIKSMAGWVKDRLIGLVRDIIPGPVRDALGIRSPSRVMAELGRYAGQGLAVGMTSTRGLVAAAAEQLATFATPTLPAFAVPPVPVAAMAGAPMLGAPGFAPFGTDSRASLHIEHFHAAPDTDERRLATELDWMMRGGG